MSAACEARATSPHANKRQNCASIAHAMHTGCGSDKTCVALEVSSDAPRCAGRLPAWPACAGLNEWCFIEPTDREPSRTRSTALQFLCGKACGHGRSSKRASEAMQRERNDNDANFSCDYRLSTFCHE